jgi:hypothetical protein
MTRGQAEPTDVTNASALDDDVIPRLSDAEEWNGAGNQDFRGAFQDHLPAVSHDVGALPYLGADLVHGAPFAEDLQEVCGPLRTRSRRDAFDMVSG